MGPLRPRERGHPGPFPRTFEVVSLVRDGCRRCFLGASRLRGARRSAARGLRRRSRRVTRSGSRSGRPTCSAPGRRRSARARRRRLRRRAVRRRRGAHGRRPGHDDVRAPRRRDPAVRADAAGRPAAEDDHPRRRRHRARHRVASFRNGCPHESVLEMDVLTGDGRVLTVDARRRARGPVPRLPQLLRHARLRAAAAHRARARPAVRACSRTAATDDADVASPQAMAEAVATPTARRPDVDFLDGTVFSADELYLTLGTFGRRRAVHLGLHRHAHLLPLDPGSGSATS